MQQGFLKQDFSDHANNLKYGHKSLHSLLLGHVHVHYFFISSEWRWHDNINPTDLKHYHVSSF